MGSLWATLTPFIIASALKIGAASNYVLPLNGFALKFACSGETTVAQVLEKIAQVNISLIGTNIQYSVPDTSTRRRSATSRSRTT